MFQAKNGSAMRAGNIIKRILNPILDKLGFPKGGKVNHAFRHGRVTMLRKLGAPGDLQKQWLGHSSLRTTDIYSHTHEDLEYRRARAAWFGLKTDVGPNGPTNGGWGFLGKRLKRTVRQMFDSSNTLASAAEALHVLISSLISTLTRS